MNNNENIKKNIEEIESWQSENKYNIADTEALKNNDANNLIGDRNLDAEKINSVLKCERDSIIAIITELFDETIEKYIDDNSILNAYIRSKKSGDKKLEVNIETSPYMYNGLGINLNFADMINELCYKRRFLIRRQERYKGVDIEHIISGLHLSGIQDYDHVVRDVLKKSKSLKLLMDYLNNMGFSGDLQYGKHTRSGCTLIVEEKNDRNGRVPGSIKGL